MAAELSMTRESGEKATPEYNPEERTDRRGELHAGRLKTCEETENREGSRDEGVEEKRGVREGGYRTRESILMCV